MVFSGGAVVGEEGGDLASDGGGGGEQTVRPFAHQEAHTLAIAAADRDHKKRFQSWRLVGRRGLGHFDGSGQPGEPKAFFGRAHVGKLSRLFGVFTPPEAFASYLHF